MPARRRKQTKALTTVQQLKLIGTHLAAAIIGAALTGLVLWPGHGPVGRKPDLGPGLDPVKTPPTEYLWIDQPAPAFPIPPYARYLAGVKIVLDPGHGGHSDRPGWKRGPTGLQEAEVNLSVALFLRDFLLAAGAEVRMTRQKDVYLDADDGRDLGLRIGMANDWGADLYLAIHHNAAEEPGPNYTTLYYHGSPDQSPASRCAGRWLLTGLNDALRLESFPPCQLRSDESLDSKPRPAEKSGLRVLRDAHVPAVLGEASFHSNPDEERRLRNPVYNRREAYGYFLGMARWAQAGLPRVRLAEVTGANGHGATAVVSLDDGLGNHGGPGNEGAQIAADSIVVRVDGKRANFTTDLKARRVRIELPGSGRHSPVRLFVDFENVYGQHVLRPTLEVE